MRSSIACARCRRSKVKCVNNGVNTTCRACETSGRECTYPPPAAGGAGGVRRESALSGGRSDVSPQGEAPRRPRIKKTIPAPTSTHSISTKESARPLLDALDASLLTPKVWTELFEIFQQHFSTDLPFLHPPTFLRPLRQSMASLQLPPIDSSHSQAIPSSSPLLLLSFLALTSRFHPALVTHHSPATSTRPSNPLVAAEYYAMAAKARLSGQPGGDSVGSPTLERTQALLMLGLHDWGMCQGVKAWIAVGIAVRSAQILGLQFEQDLDDMPLARSTALVNEAQHLKGVGIRTDRSEIRSGLSKGDAFIEQEIRRRTFWSCFIMDRYLSSGKYRPSMLNVQDLRIQLPSSERAFLFGEKVRTLMLGEEVNGNAGWAEVQSQRQAPVRLGIWSGDRERSHGPGSHSYGNHAMDQARESEENGRWEVGADEGVLSRFIKTLDLYSSIVKWSCSGGRRREQYPPWDQRSTFYSLQRQLTAFKGSLPRDLTLTPANVSAHITSRTSTSYTLMHTVHLLCNIMLHREYVPFIPLRCSKPQGPLDPPIFLPQDHQIPPDFWDESARELFSSGRDLIDLLRTCQEWQVLVETPIVGFAAYTAAFCGVYCINFPWMDPNGFLCAAQVNPHDPHTPPDHSGAQAARKALEIVGHFRKRLQMADGWFKTIQRVHLYFRRMKKDFYRNTQALEASSESDNSPESYRHLSLREGGSGGGLDEYRLLEKILKEFGSLEDEDLDMPDADADLASRLGQGLDEASDAGSSAIKSEAAMEMTDGTSDSASIRGVWNPVNTGHQRTESGNGIGPPAMSNVAMHQFNQFQTGVPSPQGHHVVSPSRSSALPQLEQASYPPDTHPYGSNPNNQFANPSDQARQASISLQQQLQPSQQPSALWSPATKEMWLNNLETRFGGDDVAAFVAGNNWEDWASIAGNKDQGGWLSTVWGGAAH